MLIKSVKIGGGLLLAAVLYFIGNTLWSLGVFYEVEPHFAGSCTRVEGVVGAEDITIDPVTGLAYISAIDRRELRASMAHNSGIYSYRPGSFETPVKLASDLAGDFHPHGISLWKAPEGEADRLFVVSHPLVEDPEGGPARPTSQVDVFALEGDTLNHLAAIKPEEPVSLNDVAAVGPERFYASIDQGSHTALGRTFEAYGRLARAGIMIGDMTRMDRALTGLVYANGVQVGTDGQTLYLAETTGKRLTAYSMDGATGALTLVGEKAINSGLDNIEIGADGTLWVVGHPRMLDFLAHADDAAARSASQVFLARASGDSFDVEEIYLNDGGEISGASVAAPVGDRFLIGSVFEPFILDCAMGSGN